MDKPIQLIGVDDPVICPLCGKRALFVADIPSDQDEDGPIYEAICAKHGEFLWQVDVDDEDE